jgi:hypothetical protein
MKLGTHIDLIGPNNFRAHSYASAQQEVSYYGLFGKRMLWNLIYSSEAIVSIIAKLGQHEENISRMLNCERIFDISNGLAVAKQRIYGEKRETGSVL